MGSETSGLQAALANARRALNILEGQAAAYGSLSIPVSLQIQLEDKRKEVAELEARLGVSPSPGAPPASAPGGSSITTGNISGSGIAIGTGASASSNVTHIKSAAGPLHTGSGNIIIGGEPGSAGASGAAPEAQSQVKILFLAANPQDTTPLRLDEEIRAIDAALRQAQFRERFDIRQHWAVRVKDIQELLLRHQPHILHFSGHGSQSNEIILNDAQGRSQPVSANALSRLFAVLKDNLRCVVLNACYSQTQAEAIAKHIDCVVGMSKAFGDQAAASFAASFYQALGYGRDLHTAFELGCLEIDLENLEEQDTPHLIAERVDPKGLFLLRPES